MNAQSTIETRNVARHAQPWFANCQTCGKLTLQTGDGACQGRGHCHGMVIELRDIAETERGALAFKPPR